MHHLRHTDDRISGQYTGPGLPKAHALYDPRRESDACGVGFVCHIDGTPSHDVIEQGIDILKNLLHRGAAGAGGVGDGAGLMAQIPHLFFREVCAALGFELPPPGRYGVGMLFLPASSKQQQACRKAIEQTIVAEGLTLLGWREVPTDQEVLIESVRKTSPSVWQCFVEDGALEYEALERKLYVLRRECERAVTQAATEADGAEDLWRFYIPSFSCRTIVYKGLLLPTQVATFYADLDDPRFESALTVVHQRYSTNTFPSWELAQPFRFLAHNGEINTLRGNINHMRAREPVLESDLFGSDMKKLLPVVDPQGSDSACLDNALELLTTAGRSLHHSMAMLIPQAWGVKYPMGPDLRGFFEYHAGLMEPWDGPAAVVFSDGLRVGALLDRNGLRPARYTITKDGFMVFASEAGVLNIPPAQVRERGSLRPGRMILVDLHEHRVLGDVEIKTQLARRQPYRRWVEENKVEVHGLFGALSPAASDPDTLLKRQKYFGYTREDLKSVLDPMATTGHEPVGSMGADEPLAVLDEQPQLLYWYFKQLFAQVTNPAIDSIREELVMSLMTFIGSSGNLLAETPQQARLVKLTSLILSTKDLARLRDLDEPGFLCRTLPAGFAVGGTGQDLAAALDALCREAEAAVAAGENIIVLSDRESARRDDGHPRSAGRICRQPTPYPGGQARGSGPHRGDRRSPRGDAHGLAARVWSLGHQPLSGLRDHHRSCLSKRTQQRSQRDHRPGALL